MHVTGQAEVGGGGYQKTPGDVTLRQTGLSWKQLERIAQDRKRWREVVQAYAPGGAKGLSKQARHTLIVILSYVCQCWIVDVPLY